MTRGRPKSPVYFLGGRPAKACSRCGEVKLLRFFSPLKGGAQGRHAWCKVCMTTYRRDIERIAADNLFVDREPLTDREFAARREAMWKKAREEGPRYCRCGTRLRLENRGRGKCDRCQEAA